MYSLKAQDLLDAWHRGASQPLHLRSLTLLTAAFPETPPEALSAMSIGRRDAKLLALRERVFGPDLNSIANCPGCNERLELNFKVSDIKAAGDTDSTDTLYLDIDGYNVELRLPNSLDLSAITDSSDEGTTRQILLERCVTHVTHNGRDLQVGEVPPQVLDAVTEQMAEADPQADVQLSLGCPYCGHEWREAFDIVLYFWTEIEAWVRRLLHEVHALALTYGWHEKDILEMNPWRRQFYLSLIQG